MPKHSKDVESDRRSHKVKCIRKEYAEGDFVSEVLKCRQNIQRLNKIQRCVQTFCRCSDRSNITPVAVSDIIISAPPGQGKTYGYVIPIVEELIRGRLLDLKNGAAPRAGIVAAILVPTRELVSQVFEAFATLLSPLKSTEIGLKAATLITEHEKLLDWVSVAGINGMLDFRSELKILHNAADAFAGASVLHCGNPVHPGGPTVLISTAVKFVDHWRDTMTNPERKLDMTNLRWVVIDEADELMQAAHGPWVRVLSEVTQEKDVAREVLSTGDDNANFNDPVLSYFPFGFPAKALGLRYEPYRTETIKPEGAARPRECYLQKILSSATKVTDTINSERLDELNLLHPVTFSAEEEWLSHHLRNHICVHRAEHKELGLCKLLFGISLQKKRREPGNKSAKSLIFCSPNNVDRIYKWLCYVVNRVATDRSLQLATSELIGMMCAGDISNWDSEAGDGIPTAGDFTFDAGGYRIDVVTAAKSNTAREATIRDLKRGKINILLATDVFARGLDISGLDAVIHYDFPRDQALVVHRSGRTGRMGSTGDVYFFAEFDKATEMHNRILHAWADRTESQTEMAVPVDVITIEMRQDWVDVYNSYQCFE